MTKLDIGAVILEHFPKAIDCVNGHLGPVVESIEQELDDDRYRDIKVKRCGHCNMPVGGDEYV
jgi:hypothetical protein